MFGHRCAFYNMYFTIIFVFIYFPINYYLMNIIKVLLHIYILVIITVLMYVQVPGMALINDSKMNAKIHQWSINTYINYINIDQNDSNLNILMKQQ